MLNPLHQSATAVEEQTTKKAIVHVSSNKLSVLNVRRGATSNEHVDLEVGSLGVVGERELSGWKPKMAALKQMRSFLFAW